VAAEIAANQSHQFFNFIAPPTVGQFLFTG